jgi:hypothetical protein
MKAEVTARAVENRGFCERIKLDGKKKELIGRRLAEIPNLLAEWQEVEYDPATGEAKFHYEIYFAQHLKVTAKAGRILDAYQYSTLDRGPREPE